MSAPNWLADFADLPNRVSREDLAMIPHGGNEETRASAVLILLGDSPVGPDLLITQRSSKLRSHPGQPAFPGGTIDATDSDASSAAIREAVEETGVDEGGIVVLGELPTLYLPPSNFHVTPILAWWMDPSEVRPVNESEVERVERITLAELATPENRYRIELSSGFVTPAFVASGLTIWGFTAGLIDRLLFLTGREIPWDPSRILSRP
ncbi:MAG TPA: CoA pyrophosphatase [Candidatus Nanopelagicaceae bacterium]|nr:CoA pyrophosphatase [Candidatus Nanopelagicaceae bacterium]